MTHHVILFWFMAFSCLNILGVGAFIGKARRSVVVVVVRRISQGSVNLECHCWSTPIVFGIGVGNVVGIALPGQRVSQRCEVALGTVLCNAIL